MRDEAARRAAIVDRPAKPAASAMQQIARGSAWTIAARWSIRGIGLISTIILARLLEPADYGIVAMAMVTMAFIQVFADSGQDMAVIRHASPTTEHFDTAWTMSVCAGALIALALIATAPLAGWYYHEPRVVPVIRVLAIAAFADGFTNVGAVVGFRRDLAFDKEFRFMVVGKFSAIAVAIPLAVVLRNYWALAIGIVCGRAFAVITSYYMHPYRPGLRLTKLGEIWSYSAWTQFAAVGHFFGDQTDQIVVGGIVGTVQMGAYNIAEDVAATPTGELVVPATRSVFPVYATLLKDPARLAELYLSVLSITAIVALSTGVGVALVADDLVAVVLGPKWTAAALLVPWLAVAAGMLGVGRSVNSVLSVTGNARLNAMRLWAFAALFAPLATMSALAWGAEGVAAARMIVTLLFIPIMFYSLMRVIPVTSAEILACLWRPALATLLMAAAIWLSGAAAISSVALRLFCNVGLGAVVFTTSLLVLWFVAGCPAGAERMLLRQARDTVRALRARMVSRARRAQLTATGQADL